MNQDTTEYETQDNQRSDERQRLRQILDRVMWEKVSVEGRQRINRIRLVYPDKAVGIEMELIRRLQKNPDLTFDDQAIIALIEQLNEGAKK